MGIPFSEMPAGVLKENFWGGAVVVVNTNRVRFIPHDII